MAEHNIVYSTNPDWKKDNEAAGDTAQKDLKKGMVYISRETKGRKGKGVTVIEGLRGDLKSQLKEMQRICGSGGTVKGNHVEVQGDHRTKIAEFLTKKGTKVKFKGG